MNKPTQKIFADVVFYFSLAVLIFILLCQFGIFPFRYIYIKSGSMAPTFDTGDLAIVKIDNNLNPKTGDIVFYKDQGSDVIHRVVSNNNGVITTKGDFNNAIDLKKINKVNGLFLFSIPLLGYVFFFVQVYLYWIITFLLIGMLIAVLHKNRFFPFNKKKKEVR